jgi:hypothetical protein
VDAARKYGLLRSLIDCKAVTYGRGAGNAFTALTADIPCKTPIGIEMSKQLVTALIDTYNHDRFIE